VPEGVVTSRHSLDAYQTGIVRAGRLITASLEYDVSNITPRRVKAPRSYPAPARDPGAPNELDPETLHGLAGDVVRAILPWTEADPAALYGDFLTSFGSAVGPGPHVWVGSTRHTPRLFQVTVGGTSAGRKGTAHDNVRHVLENAEPVWSRENVQGGLSSGEGLVQAMADLPGAKNFMAVETEFGRVLAVASRNGATVSDYIRQLWEGDTVRILNRSRLVLDGAYFSLVGHITATELRTKMAEVDLANGFANRVLWVYAQRSKLIPEGARIPDEIVLPIAMRVTQAIEAARGLGEMRRSRLAEHRWAKAYREMAETRLPGLLGAVTDRREAQCLRLSMVFAALDGSRMIKPEHVDAALAYWRYCEETAAFVFGRSSGNPKADKVLAALRRAGGEMTRSEIRRDVFSNNIEKPGLDAVRDALVEAAAITVETIATGGRDAELFKLSE
jgi:hypothetical protein